MGSGVLVWNEKTKATSGVITNLGAALFASAFGRAFVTGADSWVAVWIVFGLAAMGIGIQSLSGLMEDGGDG